VVSAEAVAAAARTRLGILMPRIVVQDGTGS
jgi:hypothetical protein